MIIIYKKEKKNKEILFEHLVCISGIIVLTFCKKKLAKHYLRWKIIFFSFYTSNLVIHLSVLTFTNHHCSSH